MKDTATLLHLPAGARASVRTGDPVDGGSCQEAECAGKGGAAVPAGGRGWQCHDNLALVPSWVAPAH